MRLSLSKIEARGKILENHSLLNDNIIKDVTDLQIFMEHHVFAVWDFMSLMKSLQHHVCPSVTCWVPTQKIRCGAARLVNEIVLAEESDIDMDGASSISHHDLYCQAMLEVGADAYVIQEWVESVRENGVFWSMDNTTVPAVSLRFMRKTFEFIDTGEPHIIAAAFCFGRETVIPLMFRRLADNLNLTKLSCPKFHYYLERHIEIDGEKHGPASIKLVEDLCGHDPVKIHQAEKAALDALDARITFWNDILEIILHQKDNVKHGAIFSSIDRNTY